MYFEIKISKKQCIFEQKVYKKIYYKIIVNVDKRYCRSGCSFE